MDDLKILDSVERYIRGEMNMDERLYFENLRKTSPDVDQLVVEHTLFLQQMNRFGDWKKFKSALHDIHTDLAEQGKIKSQRLQGKAKVVYLWKKYKRVTAIAASIAGITTISLFALVSSLSPKTSNTAELESLKRIVTVQGNTTKKLQSDLINVKPSSLPYGISKTTSDIAEPIFTLGFPRDEIVYGEGYLSAPTGFNGDSLSCQITVAANPGNSGGPIFNHNGEVIGILSAKETQTEGAVFAVQSKYIYRVIDELKKNSLYKNVKLSTKTSLAGMNKVQQVKKIQDFVFMVKGD